MEKNSKIKNFLKIIYSIKYQAFIIITHDNNIPVFKLELHDQFFELNFIGRLIGHLSFVLCGCLIEEIGILVTIDENIVVKFWDI